MADLISPEYKQLITAKHKDKPWGGAGKSWVPTILPILNKFPPGKIRILDFGCGRGTLKPAIEPLHPDVIVTEYDPGVPGKDVLPMEPVEYVVCTDVMEHVEEPFVDVTLRTIDWLAINGVFFNIDIALSKSFLPDGRNTHITLHPAAWWKERLNTYITDMDWTIHEESRGRIVVSGWRKTHVE